MWGKQSMRIGLFLSWFSSFLTKDSKHLIILCLIRSSSVLIISSKNDRAIGYETCSIFMSKTLHACGKRQRLESGLLELWRGTECSQSAKPVCASPFLLCPPSCCVLCWPVVAMFLLPYDHMRVLPWRTRFWISGGTESSCVLVVRQYDQHCSVASFLSSYLGSIQ